MYYKEQYLPEIYYMKHRHDNDDKYVDYENKILDKSLTPYLYGNDRMAMFLNMSKRLVSMLFDNFNIIKNYRNYTVDKYYYKHKN
jgi:hypothetical protein